MIMKHLILLLYLMSYTSGIGAITLGGFYYMKTKNMSIKYISLADIFFTVFLFFDTLNFYTDVLISQFPTWLQIVKIAGLTFASIGIIYFFTLAAYSAMEIELLKQKKFIYFILTALFFILIISIIYILYCLKLISLSVALQTGFFLPNIFTSIWSVYNIIFITKNWTKISIKIKQFVFILVIFIAIMMPISVLSNMIQYWHSISIPIAYSPIEYFFINLLAIIFAKRNLQAGNFDFISLNKSVHNNFETVVLKQIQQSFEEFSILYKLTQREIEIINLVVAGFSNQEIAAKLFISSNTVRNHIYNIYKKLEIKNRFELINLISTKTYK